MWGRHWLRELFLLYPWNSWEPRGADSVVEVTIPCCIQDVEQLGTMWDRPWKTLWMRGTTPTIHWSSPVPWSWSSQPFRVIRIDDTGFAPSLWGIWVRKQPAKFRICWNSSWGGGGGRTFSIVTIKKRQFFVNFHFLNFISGIRRKTEGVWCLFYARYFICTTYVVKWYLPRY